MQSLFRAHRRLSGTFYMNELRHLSFIWKKGSDHRQWRYALKNRVNIDRL